MSANPRAIWTPTPAEVLLVELQELSRFKSQMLAFIPLPTEPSLQFTDYPSTAPMVQSAEDIMDPKFNESPFESQFSSIPPIPGNLAKSQMTPNDSSTTDSVAGSISTTTSVSVAPTPAASSSALELNALLSRQSFPLSCSPDARFSVQPSPDISVSISASITSSPASTQISILSCPIFGCSRTFTQNHEYNRHQKSHTHPHKCQHCGRGFETPKDVRRHVNDVHETTKRYFCTVSTCGFSKSPHVERKGFSRKENCRRHMRTKHNLPFD